MKPEVRFCALLMNQTLEIFREILEIVCEKNAKGNINLVELKYAKYFVNPKIENEVFG